jgi:hypothetical protein
MNKIQPPTNDELKELTNQVLEIYEDGKYANEPTDDKDKQQKDNRKKEIKSALKVILSTNDKKKIVEKRVCGSLLNHIREYKPEKIRELRRLNMEKKRKITMLEERIAFIEGDNIGRCELCKTKFEDLQKEAYDEITDEEHLFNQLREEKEKTSRWKKEFINKGHQLQKISDELQFIKRENHIISNEDWRKQQQEMMDIFNENKKLKDKVNSKELSKEQKKLNKIKKAEEALQKMKDDMNDSDSD